MGVYFFVREWRFYCLMINRKKLVATAKRREGVYNRTVEPSVTFFEKGAAADKVKPYFKNKIRRTERLAVTCKYDIILLSLGLMKYLALLDMK